MLGRKIRPKAEKAKEGLRQLWKKLPTSFTKSEEKAATTPSGSEETTENEVPAVSVVTETVIPKTAAGLRITVTARFELPVDYTNSHTYQTSPEFVGSDKICNALVNRIQHCANELITRHDPDAAQPLLSSPPHIKDARYHLIFQVERDGQPWGQQYFACFQKQPMDAAAARKVIYGTDRIISLFLQRHDPGFHWELPPVVSEEQIPHKTYKPVIGCAQPLDCIPNYSGMPGYTIELSLKTQHRGHARNWAKNIESRQNSPLTLHSGESLMAKVQDTIQRAFEGRETAYDEAHFGCNGLEGTGGCQHYEEDAFGLEVKLRNNIGPEFSHFNFKIQTFQLLFTQDQTVDFDEFVELIEGNVEDLRDEADAGIGSLDDLRVQIQYLSCKDWSMERALAVSLDCSITECRTTIEAVLERVQAGLTKTLQGQGFSAAVTAHKRGHLVLDTFIPGIEPETTAAVQSTNQAQTEAENRLAILKLLRERIGQDITAVCKDTCSLGEVGFMINLKITPGCDEDNLSKYSTTPPVSICLSQRKIVKKARQENLRVDSPEPSTTSENEAQLTSPENEEQLNITQDYDCMEGMVSAKGDASPASTPSLADIDSAQQTDGVATPSSARKPSATDQWGTNPKGARGRTFSKSTRGSSMSDTYTEEPSVIHHSAHLGDATLRLIENLDEEETDVPSTDVPSTDVPSTDVPSTDVPSTVVPSTYEIPREVSSTSDDSATKVLIPEEQKLEIVLQEEIYTRPKSPEETAVQESSEEQLDIVLQEEIYERPKSPEETAVQESSEEQLDIVLQEEIYERPKSPEETLVQESAKEQLEIVLQEEIYERPKSPEETTVQDSAEKQQPDIPVHETQEHETQQLETQRLETQQLEMQEHGTQQLEMQEHGTQQLGTQQLETQQIEMQQLETQQCETQELETQQLETQEHETQEHEMHETQEHETREHEMHETQELEMLEGQTAVSVTPDCSSVSSDGPYTTDAPTQVTTITTITPVVPRKSSKRHGDPNTDRESFRLSQDFGNQLRIFSLSGTLGGLPPACTKIHAEGHIPRSQVSSIFIPSVSE
ncbi:unnamed protein product [Clonostachys solani]|uniref:Pt repeat family protein n=1 Tax=Clonostachys solani TaxID=160281 RepID=A0A9P0EJ64_9HYPO|nr:unnamed protein product [Clonostachys solani]